ncbi:hypothetical protein PACTADRAFT_70383 [Pachysolen tannophilus NRRL Y-2460]|uniref:FAD-binding domain-containing protein n=1 Tax=Pachysolen tannophilus NRRL Y-2460 TaxID=669874 RepID=A0A1E4TQN4_PACTA|nr:hypothetical protein PACTADRAFT_70383 [Pachysolen tannophilus NRRL Y-2460]
MTTLDTDVLVVGAGPAGLMLASLLARLGVKVMIVDDRATKTCTGRADGVQPKTMETFKQMGLAHELSGKGVRVYDITMWEYSDEKKAYKRVSCEPHFSDVVDLRDPYILLLHQGMIEDAFIRDMSSRGVSVKRNSAFQSYEIKGDFVHSRIKQGDTDIVVKSKYVVGSDGAHSAVRKCMPEVEMVGASTESVWGVIDGELETTYPDFWSKTVISSKSEGTVLGIPRERNMTRLYIELEKKLDNTSEKEVEEFIKDKARKIMKPFTIEWNTVEWVGLYTVGQRVASKFIDGKRVFITGDASHSHSPKAAQGMNVSMHDSWNLGWKLAYYIKGYSTEEVLLSYEVERRKIAQDLIDFDKEHANAFKNVDPEVLKANFERNIRFICGVGADYNLNILNQKSNVQSSLKPGELPIPANAVRFIDSNPVELENAIPALGQFKVFIFAETFAASEEFLKSFSDEVQDNSVLQKFFDEHPLDLNSFKLEADKISHKRYTPVSEVLTMSLVFDTKRFEFELEQLPALFRPYKWSIYLEPPMDGPFKKWLPKTLAKKISIVVVRPDGYVGALESFDIKKSQAKKASVWLNNYFEKILVI